jgi:hypothetical protein
MCLCLVPSTHAFAQELQDVTTAPSPAPLGIRETIRQMSFAQAAPQGRGGQSVATTTESKLLLGLATGGLIVGGITMMAYGASSSCKGKEASTGSSGCDRTAMLGAVTFSGGAAVALLWALSRD